MNANPDSAEKPLRAKLTDGPNALAENHRQWIDEALKNDSSQRESKWTESIAVGSKPFIKQTKAQLQSRTRGREIEGHEEACEVREAGNGYDFDCKNSTLSPKNTYLRDESI